MMASARRLTAQQLVSKVDPDSLARAWLFRSLVGAFAFVLAMIVFSWLGDIWALLIAVVISALAVWRSDGASVHDLLSALWSRRATGRSVTITSEHKISTVRVADLRPGDPICPADEFTEQMTTYERRLAEEEASAERRNAAWQKAHERQKRLYGDRGATVSPPLWDRPNYVPPPTIRYREVIAVRPERDGEVRLGLACGQIIKRPSDEDILVLQRSGPGPKGDTEKAGRALEALLVKLQGQPSPISERHLIAWLITAGHQRSAIRHALRAAVATRLINHQTEFLQSFGRIWRAFTRGRGNNWHGEDCQLDLTKLGELWLAAQIPHDQTTVPPDAAPGNVNIKNFTVQIGDHNVVHHTSPTSHEPELEAIKKLLAAMPANTDAMRDFTEALRTLQDAVAQNKPDTPASRSAVGTILKKSSYDVLIGVLGNAVYEFLRTFAGLA